MINEARQMICERLFGSLKGQRVLLIGIGGGGDVIGTLPTYFDLQRLGVLPQTGGLTWKRKCHDPKGAPRYLHEFRNLLKVNDWIGLVGPQTCLGEGLTHIEADISAMLDGQPVITLNIAGGAAKVRQALQDYVNLYHITQIIAIDVGGDALCSGHEPTIRSPLCDQIMLAALSYFPGTRLGVIGLGADGELPLAEFYSRFEALLQRGGYLGALEICPTDIERLNQVLAVAKTECSRYPVQVAQQTSPQRSEQVRAMLNTAMPELNRIVDSLTPMDLRTGTRTGELSVLCEFTLYFDLATVYTTSEFSSLIDEALGVQELNDLLIQKGYITELSDEVTP